MRWTGVSSGSLVDEPVVLITASSQGDHAHPALLSTLGALSANVIEDACLPVSFIRSKMDDAGNIVDEKLKEDLERSLRILFKLEL